MTGFPLEGKGKRKRKKRGNFRDKKNRVSRAPPCTFPCTFVNFGGSFSLKTPKDQGREKGEKPLKVPWRKKMMMLVFRGQEKHRNRPAGGRASSGVSRCGV